MPSQIGSLLQQLDQSKASRTIKIFKNNSAHAKTEFQDKKKRRMPLHDEDYLNLEDFQACAFLEE